MPSSASTTELNQPSHVPQTESSGLPSKKFKFLVAKSVANRPATQSDNAQAELSKYLIEIRNATMASQNPFDIWIQRRSAYRNIFCVRTSDCRA
jgi:hypothetical protein